MDILNGWFNNLFNNNDQDKQYQDKQYQDKQYEERHNIKQLNKKVKDMYKPCVLTQGQRLHNNQTAKVNSLTPNLLAFNETVNTPYTNTSPFVNTNTYAMYGNANTYANGDRYSNANTYATTNTYIKGTYMKGNNRCREGFDTLQTNAVNNAELQDTTNLSGDYSQKLNRYTTEFPSIIDHSRTYSQTTDRNSNYIQNTRILNDDIEMKYTITSNLEGCYKQAPGAELVYQSDMNNVTLDTCKQRTSDLAYAGFSIKTKADGQLGCYLTNDVEGNKTSGIATRPQTSLAFKTNKNAAVGSLLLNGQLGLFNGTTFDILDTDLPAVPGCNVDGSKITVNPNSVTATWGANCKANLNSITSEFNGKCINQNNGSKDPYLQMQMLDCEPYNPSQNMTYNSATQTINAPGDNLCFDVLGGGTTDGTSVIQYQCTGGSNQKWMYGADKTLRPQHAPDKCLDIWMANNDNGAGLVIATCHGGPVTNQNWDIMTNGAAVTPNKARLAIQNTTKNDWLQIGTDSGTGGRPDASYWTTFPKWNDDRTALAYPVGHAIYTGSAGDVYSDPPNMNTILVSGDVVDPVGFLPVGTTGGGWDINYKQVICPQGYASIGDTVTSKKELMGTPLGIKCVPADCVDASPQPGNRLWSGLNIDVKGLNSNTSDPASPDNGYNLFKTSVTGPFNTIKPQCLI